MKKSIYSDSLKITQGIAKELARTILESPERSFTRFKDKSLERPLEQSSLLQPQKGAFVLALKGELGAGKTSFVQGLAKGLGVKGNVLSPTFLIVKSYKLSRQRMFYHIDCYRLKSAKELLQLEWKEIIQNPNNIVAVEWADHVKSIIPKHALWISFSHGKAGLTERKIVVG
ncbi:tRNA (adenosine(37)-N6)-threonylcarbamoyltransferase complex ATPase subunit type 1 TsaE [Patescibacteria group bacterium]|nr:tRNA (adenosine(37)-N6)-threonylcarbamoyltransferase complex ATPase subunit type 1 TsaE [Patescibacteria group bacterium]